ncbi:hypothetical protein MKZ08_09695 [Viridibacillus sp. FSL R5-0477]|uniref:Uncharacterized protein n=1 Tax=Viridibacillus arenosi FSL R5-213 TaxID=1227360 RepID=W4F3V6_9BACL|nr:MULTISPECIES: hypothetical protein [Viridibacillus]ETT86741.1 hypothetical protein C176_08512 [Viridibacillus arenosi FSL R5-213]OMC83449.1 hypothetical protein BK130_07905 [Viridibacillus sp. FSL H8-0123]OMC84437.1 hypothetical protein BK128_16225 [Viridibacillus sp. FSL H7-0596]OMC89490.1 hypothetical protein BK137_17215 [Viridibacillus arenosi]
MQKVVSGMEHAKDSIDFNDLRQSFSKSEDAYFLWFTLNLKRPMNSFIDDISSRVKFYYRRSAMLVPQEKLRPKEAANE